MKPLFRVASTLEQGAVSWFVNRSGEPRLYALDECFTSEEAAGLEKLLRRCNWDCRMEKVRPSAEAGQGACWNLLGRLIELDPAEADQLSFRVVGCLEA